MAEVPDYGNRRSWMPVVAGLLAGIGLAAIVFSLLLSAKIPGMVERRVDEILGSSSAGAGAQGEVSSGNAATDSLESGRRGAVVVAIEKVSPAVVTVTVSKVQRVTERGPIYQWFGQLFQAPPRIKDVPVSSMGSGVIVSPFGRIVTNNHVVADGGDIDITLADGRQFPGRLVATTAKYDLAVIQVQLPAGEKLPYAEMGDSDDLAIGEWAIAIGSPFGFYLNDPRPTATVGVISALNRDVKGSDEALFSDMVQTDAAINPGNSGGPLVNSSGQVVGINTFIITKSGGSEGIGFARPINTVAWVLNELTKYGKVRDAWVGIEAATIQPYHVEQMNLKVDHGLFVTKVYRDTPASAAGIQPGDVITSIAGLEVETKDAARRILYRFEVGDDVDFVVNRDGEKMDKRVHLEALKGD